MPPQRSLKYSRDQIETLLSLRICASSPSFWSQLILYVLLMMTLFCESIRSWQVLRSRPLSRWDDFTYALLIHCRQLSRNQILSLWMIWGSASGASLVTVTLIISQALRALLPVDLASFCVTVGLLAVRRGNYGENSLHVAAATGKTLSRSVEVDRGFILPPDG